MEDFLIVIVSLGMLFLGCMLMGDFL